MRIIQVIPSLSVGGAERVAALLALAQRRAGDTVAVVSLYDPAASWIERELREAGVALHHLAKRPGLDPPLIRRLARALRAIGPDIVHTHLHTLKYVLAARLLLRRRGALVHTVHNLAEREAEGYDRALSRVAFRACAVPVAIGDEVARSLRAAYGITPRWTIPNGVVVADFAAQPGAGAAARETLGLGPEVPLLLTAGRLNAQKNQAALLEAFADPRLAALGAHLLIAGEGDLRPALEARARALGIGDRVRFLGVVSTLPALLAAADAFVLSSDWEGNPLVVMEAMAAGKPIIATSVGCVPKLVSAATGRLVRPGDRAALSAALVEVAGDRDLARALGGAGAEVARDRFDVAQMAAAYRALYHAVCARDRRGWMRGLAGGRGWRA
ncbi:MAG: glycosyltransferase [Pseudomonadota bacterium]